MKFIFADTDEVPIPTTHSTTITNESTSLHTTHTQHSHTSQTQCEGRMASDVMLLFKGVLQTLGTYVTLKDVVIPLTYDGDTYNFVSTLDPDKPFVMFASGCTKYVSSDNCHRQRNGSGGGVCQNAINTLYATRFNQ